MADQETTIGQLKDWVGLFVRARHWEKYHRPRNLSESIAIEAAELLELFQWDDGRDEQNIAKSSALRNEVADVVIYCLSLSDTAGFDLSEAIALKLRQNAEKYPVSLNSNLSK